MKIAIAKRGHSITTSVIQSSHPHETSSAFVRVHRSWRTELPVPPLLWLATNSPPLAFDAGGAPMEMTVKSASTNQKKRSTLQGANKEPE